MGRQTQGFSLLELLATLLIMAVLASVAVPVVQSTVRKERELDLRRALREIRSALDAYYLAGQEGRIEVGVDESGYPPTLQVLVQGVPDTKVKSKKWVFLRRIPRDPFAPQDGGGGEQDWGLRSYASPHDAPLAGADVYDVYSRSTLVGLNGVPYREW